MHLTYINILQKRSFRNCSWLKHRPKYGLRKKFQICFQTVVMSESSGKVIELVGVDFRLQLFVDIDFIMLNETK